MFEYVLLCCFCFVMVCILITINDNSWLNRFTIFVLSIPLLPLVFLFWLFMKLFEVDGD